MADVLAVICGSPQRNGKCDNAANRLAGLLRERFPKADVRGFSVASQRIAPCIGCNACAKTGRCVMHDDMDAVLCALGEATRLFVVSPVFFSGPPAQMKGLLDRLQPLYYTQEFMGLGRPAHLVAVGEGGDPHGFDPLVGCCTSALSVAGFALDDVVACIGMNRRQLFACVDSLVDGIYGCPSHEGAAVGKGRSL